MENYRPHWSGIVKPHDLNDVYDSAFNRLDDHERTELEASLARLLDIRNLGDRGANEVLAKLGLYLNGQTGEFTRLTIEGQKALRRDSQ